MQNTIIEAINHLVKGIVDFPNDVDVSLITDGTRNTIQVKVNPEDLGKIIGKRGKTANALREIVGNLSNRKYRLDIFDEIT